mmetsp:Transcript_25658/g.51785  ORF Transcript_25658/g.51785 Transcript_25658/m.51785 type:complete len:211 (+) Transcript_25658:195-827(+)
MHRRRLLLLPPVFPLLSLRWRGSVFALVVGACHLPPIRGEDGTAGGLEGLVHGAARLIVRPLVDLFEELVQGLVPSRLLVLQLTLDVPVNLAPISLLLARRRISWLIRDIRDLLALLEIPPLKTDVLLCQGKLDLHLGHLASALLGVYGVAEHQIQLVLLIRAAGQGEGHADVLLLEVSLAGVLRHALGKDRDVDMSIALVPFPLDLLSS